MSDVLYFPNLKKDMDRPIGTATKSGSKVCLDVNIAAVSSASPLPVALSSYAYKEHRFHYASATNINASGGAFVQIATAADIANTIAEMRVNWNGGYALIFSKGADATAAALSANRLAIAGAGQTLAIGAVLASGDKVWVRAVQNAAVTAGELTVTFLW